MLRWKGGGVIVGYCDDMRYCSDDDDVIQQILFIYHCKLIYLNL